MSGTAQKQWESENSVRVVDDNAFVVDMAEQQRLQREKPWKNDPGYFKHVRISALALLKMVMHARRGGKIEVMGVMQGKIAPNQFIILDAIPLPVEATETRVNAATEAYEYLIQYRELMEQIGKNEHVVGWYHSHPGYGCWLSGIDVKTQELNQTHQDPWLAIVIDPVRTISAGKVEISCFRVFPENYKPTSAVRSEWQSIPSNKIEDFGVHLDRYYPITPTIFKSSTDSSVLDLLWNKYWTHTLSSSPLVSNRDYANGQIHDVVDKMEKAESELGGHSKMLSMSRSSDKKEESAMEKASRDAVKVTSEALHGLFGQVLKDSLFNKAVR